MSIESLAQGSAEGSEFSIGRCLFLGDLYDLSTEQPLAQGPRMLKRTPFYSLYKSCLRWWTGVGSFQREVGSFTQSLLSSLKGDRKRLAQAEWRRSDLPFRFPKHDPNCETVVLLFTANRPWYLRRALRALSRFWPKDAPLLIVSQDGTETTTTSFIRSLAPEVAHYEFRDPVTMSWAAWRRGSAPYYRIAQHFGASIKRAFRETDARRIIILEDDIEIGADFFPFMSRYAGVLDSQPDILALSAWNDHAAYASDPDVVHLTDCFPGQGWMITRDDWQTLEDKWPDKYWDEWMRRDDVRLGRYFLRPELNRVRNFGRAGTGSSLFYDRFVAPMRWQTEPLLPEPKSVSTSEYRRELHQVISNAKRVEHIDDVGDEDAVLIYDDEKSFVHLAEMLKIVSATHSSGPRGGFEGVLILRVRDVQLFVVRRDTWTMLSSGT